MGFFDSIRFFDRSRAPKGCWPWPNSDGDPYGVPSPVVQSELLRTACHEAGHAVVCRYFGIEVIHLSIRKSADSNGSVTTVMTDPQQQAWALGWSRKIAGKNNPPSPDRGSEIGLRPRDHFVHEASLHADLHEMLAGAVAENIEYGPLTSWEETGGKSDLKGFRLLVSAHYGNLDGFISDSLFASILDRYSKSCHEILSKPEIRIWHEEVVKAALRSEHGVLTGDEIDSLRSPKNLHLVVPDSFDDAREIADRSRCGQVVAIEFAGCEPELERRLVDFSSGVCFARDSAIRRVGQGRYLLLPPGRDFDPDEDPDNSPWDPDRSPLGPGGPTLMCMADETSEGSVADAAIFERVARLVADLYGVEFEDLSAETTIEDLEATAVSVWPRGANRKFLSVGPALVLLEVENEFGLLFEEEEISDLGDSEGFMPLGLLVDFVQGKLMEKRGLSPPA